MPYDTYAEREVTMHPGNLSVLACSDKNFLWN
jgi:hypothetical protein